MGGGFDGTRFGAARAACEHCARYGLEVRVPSRVAGGDWWALKPPGGANRTRSRQMGGEWLEACKDVNATALTLVDVI